MIRARYDGSCTRCGAAYKAMHRIGWEKETGTTLCLPCTLPGGVSPEHHGASGRWYPELGEVVVLDVETTGTRAQSDRIVEIALVTTDKDLNPVEVWTTLVDPGRDVGPSRIHHIENADVQGAPTVQELAGEILERITPDKVLVAHNLPFDLAFLRAELERAGTTLPSVPALCTLQTSRRLHPGEEGHSLEALGRKLGLLDEDEEQEHAAAGDALLTVLLLQHLVRQGRKERRRHQVALTAGGTVEIPRSSAVRLHPRGSAAPARDVTEQTVTPAVPSQRTVERETERTASSQRARWAPRNPHAGWEETTTPLGGRRVGEELDEVLGALRSGARVWHNLPDELEDPSTRWWRAVTQKLLQRGENPPLPQQAAALLGRGTEPAGTEPYTPSGLHPTYEVPFWEHVARTHPELLPWLHPQASLEDLAGVPSEEGRRYVDFLLYVPGREPLVIELDGSGHDREKAVDRERDQLLAKNARVLRLPGSEWRSGELAAELIAAKEHARTLPSGKDVHEASTYTRLTWALVEGVSRGALAGSRWQIQVEDDQEVAPAVLGTVLDLLQAVADLGGLQVMPEEVVCNGEVWKRSEHWEVQGTTETNGAELHVHLQGSTPVTAPLPPGAGQVVIRSCVMPSGGQWANRDAPRRPIADTPEARSALRQILSSALGHQGFREGQEDSVMRVLAGEDLSVLLPTGAGKTLVYQLAGLLQPGTTVIVDPIISLVQDQHRRMLEAGMDRVLPLSSQHQKNVDDRREAHTQLTSGESLYVLMAPERLQTKELRAALRAASSRHGITLAVVDEAHCVSEWGHDFRTPYLRLGKNLREHCRDVAGHPANILALTGTASPAVLRDVLFELEIPEASLIQPASFDRPNLTYQVVRTSEGEWRAGVGRALLEDVPAHLGKQSITQVGRGGVVFVPWTNGEFGVETLKREVDTHLARQGSTLKSAVYSGKAPRGRDEAQWSKEKTENATKFTRGELDLLVATKAFGMGIDKPDIAYTIHVGFPSSIEAYAQEAGRAGRDLQPALCTLVSTVADPEEAKKLLDPRLTWEEFLAAASRYQTRHSMARSDDLARQLHFLTGSFPGARGEIEAAAEVLAQLERGPRGGIVAIPRTGENTQERALYRLSLVGIVEDYTVEYGARKIEVRLHPYSIESLDEALLSYLGRAEPGKRSLHRAQLEGAPTEVGARARHHLAVLVRKVYEVVGPARRNALAGVADLARAEDDTQVRERILSYLARGPLADVLGRVRDENLTFEEGLAEVERIPAAGNEWVGAATRHLEGSPNDPLALLLRGLGEAAAGGDDETTLGYLTQAYRSLEKKDRPVRALAWSLAVLRRRSSASWAKAPLLWQAWDDAGREEDTSAVEAQVLTKAAEGVSDLGEVMAVLARRRRALAQLCREHIERRVGA